MDKGETYTAASISGDRYDIRTEALQVFTGEEAAYYRLLPCRKEPDGVMHCLGESGRDYSMTIREVEAIYGFRTDIRTISPDELSRLISTRYRQSAWNQDKAAPCMKGGEDFAGELIKEAFTMKASDIHMEPGEDRCKIRFRMDGKLMERYTVDKSAYPGLVNRIKIMSNLDISEKRLPQDGRILHTDGRTRFDVRTSVMPTIHGEKIVLRLLAADSGRLSLESLGFDGKQYKDYTDSVSRPHGMILISGPTGSGKSTTLYATLERLNRPDNNILTIEDPVEYTLEGISQVQLKEEIGLTFPMALRTFLRQDPDIIMLGEIRDEETAEMAVRSSLTGHLLLSTLHTNNAWGCITRLTDMGIHPYLLSETLAACVAQRLVRLLCPHCKHPVTPPMEFLADIGARDSACTFEACGCDKCYFTGYSGRKAIYEVIAMDRGLREAVRNNSPEADKLLSERGIKTLRDSALALYLSGETSLEEIYPIIHSGDK